MAWILGVLFLAGLAVLGWVARQVYVMNSKVTSTEQRVDRIVAVLPDIRVRLAKEEVERTIRLCIMTSKPFVDNAENWISQVNLIDTVEEQQFSWKVKLENQQDRSAIYAVCGVANSSNDEVHSMRFLENASLELDRRVSAPAYIDIDFSYCFRTVSRNYKKDLESLFKIEPIESPFTKKLNGWKDLADELEDNSDNYNDK